MLSKSTSPFRNQQRETEFSIPSNALFRTLNARKPSVTSLARVNAASPERCDRGMRLPYLNGDTHSVSDFRWDPAMLETAIHDLRHPAAALQSYSDWLAETIAPNVSKEEMELVHSIRATSQFMLQLLDDTAEILQSGTVRLHTAPSIVADAVAACVATSCPLAAQKGINLNFIQEGRALPVPLDVANISRVFNNLIGNAIKHCPSGTVVDVRISRAEDHILVSVQDNGPGISPSDLKTLFLPFQPMRAHTCDEGGTGLGLAISKRIVELHGGQIEVASEFGKGTTVYVSLPAQVRQIRKKSRTPSS